jgi:hypothetical protein
MKAPVIAGLGIGILFVFLLSISNFYNTISSELSNVDPSYYSPLIQLSITGLQERYFAGERIDFAVTQKFGGCVYPESVVIKNLETGDTVWRFNGTEANYLNFACPAYANPAISRMIMNSASENLLILNDTGPYAVIASHQFKTVQKEFTVIAIGDSDTPPETIARLSSMSKNLDVVKALLEKYPNANSTVTANFNSELFKEYQKYNPSGIVQYSADKIGPDKEGRALLLTIIFDRYYRFNTTPLTIIQCTSENYSWLYATQLPAGISEIEKC